MVLTDDVAVLPTSVNSIGAPPVSQIRIMGWSLFALADVCHEKFSWVSFDPGANVRYLTGNVAEDAAANNPIDKIKAKTTAAIILNLRLCINLLKTQSSIK